MHPLRIPSLRVLYRASWAAISSLQFRVAAAALLCTWVPLSIFWHDVRVTRVQASATYGNDPAFSASHTLDHLTLESRGAAPTFWLLPNHETGWIRFELARSYEIESISIVNTHNRHNNDRSAARGRIELTDAAGRSTSSALALEPYPTSTSVDERNIETRTVTVWVDEVTGQGGGLNEVVIRGHPPGLLGRWRDGFLAVGAALFALLAMSRLPRPRQQEVWQRNIVFALLVVMIATESMAYFRFASSVSTFEWMGVFDVSEFHSWSDAGRFFRELRVPIPPILALLEIVEYRLTGANDIITTFAYRVFLAGSYVLALALAYPRPRRMVSVGLLSFVFVWATSLVHPANPQLYDIFLPLSLLAALAFARSAWAFRPAQGLSLFLAGLSLANFGLARPISFFLMPLPVAVVLWRIFRRGEPAARLAPTMQMAATTRWRRAATFLAPIVLLFGIWQAHEWVAHGQLTMSNHSGFNEHRAWPMVPEPPLLAERTQAPFHGLNNPDHVKNSDRLQRAIVAFCVTHPFRAAMNVLDRVAVMIEPVVPNGIDVQKTGLTFYRWIVHLAFMCLFLGTLCDAALMWRTRSFLSDDMTDSLILWMTTGCTLLFALGEAGEEYRFVVSVLPMLTLTPAICLDRVRALAAHQNVEAREEEGIGEASC